MPHATAYVAGSDDTNEPSQYASSDTLRRRTQRPGGDLSEPATLREAVHDRTFRGEIILFAFNFCSISDALALMATLRRASFEHFLPFTDGRATCLAMQHLAAVRGGLQHATGTQQPHHPNPSSSPDPSPDPRPSPSPEPEWLLLLWLQAPRCSHRRRATGPHGRATSRDGTAGGHGLTASRPSWAGGAPACSSSCGSLGTRRRRCCWEAESTCCTSTPIWCGSLLTLLTLRGTHSTHSTHPTHPTHPTHSTASTASRVDSQALLRDPYLALKTPPLASYALVLLPEKPINGGLWYARASGRGRGAHWVMEEAMPAG